MPDWVSHLLIGLIIVQLFDIRKKSLVLLGSILPDLVGKFKMLNYFFPGSPDWVIPLSNFWHTPLASFIAVCFVSLFFSYPYLTTSFLIWLGDISHFLADETTKSFLWQGYLPLLWADQYWIALIFLALLYYLLVMFNIKLLRDAHGKTKTTD